MRHRAGGEAIVAFEAVAGPAPTISTFLPVGAPVGTVQPFSTAISPTKRSTAWMDTGQRVVGDQRPPRLLEVTFAGVSQPALDVLAGRAGESGYRE